MPPDFLDKFETSQEIDHTIDQINCPSVALLITWGLGTLSLGVYMYMVRYRHEVRVCAGDYLTTGALKSYPYMEKSGKFLKYYTFGKGMDSLLG